MSPLLSVLLWLAVALASVALSLWLWLSLAARTLTVPEFFDEVHEVQTDDGATIVLARLLPKGERASLPPIVMCHGLAMNRRAFALFPKHSFAVALAERGRDVWLLELRGASDKRLSRTIKRSTFDDYAAHDIPAAIEFVQTQTDAPEVDWVGFSMGGMLAYAHLGARDGKGIRKLVTIGSPVNLSKHPISSGMALLPLLFAPVFTLSRTPFRALSLMVAPLVWPGVPHRLSRGLRGEHYSARAFRGLMANSMSDVPTGVSRQFVRWVRTGRFDSEDHALDYLDGISRITVPTLVIAGSTDGLAPPPAALDAAARIRRAPVQSLVIGPSSGAGKDYDHMDLILGRDALREVLPAVESWLT